MTTAPAYDNSVRIGYARVSTRAQEHQAQLDALAAAHCREIITETASTRGDRPRLREALGRLQPGDTLVIYKPDRVARSMKELLVLLEDQLHARGINLHILTGICAGIHRPDGATIADKMLFMVAAMAAEMERDLIRERTLDGLRAAEAQGRRGGRPAAVDDDVLAVARARQSRGESVTAIARHLKIGRSTLYRACNRPRETLHQPPWSRPGKTPDSAEDSLPLTAESHTLQVTMSGNHVGKTMPPGHASITVYATVRGMAAARLLTSARCPAWQPLPGRPCVPPGGRAGGR